MMSNVSHIQRSQPISGGGGVVAIVPQNMDELWRVSKAVHLAGLAPAALVGKKEGDEAISAISVAIMSGAELGLKPMVALRSFTVINGKPALYGDGLINVVRQSGKVAYLRTGHDERNGKLIGWCEAKRNDTGEEKRVEFSQEDATRAGLWQTEAIVTKYNKFERKNEQKPNDSPWWRFPQRMLAWRAAGYCLRELFGDVLGGIRDEFEAREMGDFEEMRDVTPPVTTPSLKPPSPPKSSEPDAKVIEAGPSTEFDLGAFLEELETSLASAKDEAEVEEIWTDYDAPAVLETEGHADMTDTAHAIKMRALTKLSPLNAG